MNAADAQALGKGALQKLPHELKVTLPATALHAILAALEADPEDCKHRTVWMVDTPSLALWKAGVVLRVRHKENSANLTVKVRPVRPARLKGRWEKSRALKVEVDVVGRRHTLAASVEHDRAKTLPLGDFHTLLSPLQTRLLSEVALLRAPWTELRATSPAAVQVWKVKPLVLERWRLPSGKDVLELSTHVDGEELAERRRWLDGLLHRAHVPRAVDQVTKSQLLLATLRDG